MAGPPLKGVLGPHFRGSLDCFAVQNGFKPLFAREVAVHEGSFFCQSCAAPVVCCARPRAQVPSPPFRYVRPPLPQFPSDWAASKMKCVLLINVYNFSIVTRTARAPQRSFGEVACPSPREPQKTWPGTNKVCRLARPCFTQQKKKESKAKGPKAAAAYD